MAIRENIRSLLELHGKTAREVERDLGLGNGYISKLGHGNPNLRTVQRIADYFGCPVAFILEDDDFAAEESKPQGIPLFRRSTNMPVFTVFSRILCRHCVEIVYIITAIYIVIIPPLLGKNKR